MPHKEKTLEELSKKSGNVSSKASLIGFDGFVDKIVSAVKERHGSGSQFDAYETLSAFGEKIAAASGQSTNIELFIKKEKLGGNGPILANALLSTGQKVRYIGALGSPNLHPVFEDFAKKTDAVSLCEPGETTAIEFSDGKLMLGTMASLDSITYDKIIKTMGEGAFIDAVSRADLIAPINWTMTPHLNSLLNDVLDKILANLGPHENRTFLFDICDPSKRSPGDLSAYLSTIKRFMNFGAVILALNFEEALHVYKALGHKEIESSPDNLQKLASDICSELELNIVAVHQQHDAACATRQDSFYVEGYYTDSPKILTGAGDHFNAGFATGFVLGLSPECCLTLATAFAGYYVRNATSPTLTNIADFLRSV